MSDLYGKWLARAWNDPEIRALSDRDFRIFVYLCTNEHRTISGVYRLPVVWAAHDLSMRTDDVEAALYHHLAAWAKYDPTTEEVWVRNLAAVNCDQRHTTPFAAPRADKREDKRLPALRRGLEGIRSAWLRSEWLHHYAAWGPALGMVAPEQRVDAPILTLMRDVHAPSEPPSPGGGRRVEAPSEGLGRGIEAPSEGDGRGSDAPPKPIAVAGSSSSSSSNSNSVPDGTGKPARMHLRHEAGALMPLVRELLYLPDGKAPAGYNDGRDYEILVMLLESGLTPGELEVALRGVAGMRDDGAFAEWSPPIRRGEKMTVRMLYNTRHGVVQMLESARSWYFAHQAAAPSSALSALTAGIGR